MKSKQPSKNIEADKDKVHFCFAKCRFPTWQQYSLEKSIKVSYSALNFPRGLMKWWWPGINSPFKSLEGRQCRKLPPKLFTHCCYNTGQSWKLPPVAKIVTIQGTWAITITGPEKSWYLNVFPWKWIHWCCPTNLYWGERRKSINIWTEDVLLHCAFCYLPIAAFPGKLFLLVFGRILIPQNQIRANDCISSSL